MPLTLRTNGSSGSNIIQAAWFNDFLNLFTGVMTDQPVTFNNLLLLKGITFTTPTAPTLALAAGTNMGIGAYTYAIGFQEGNGKTTPGTTANTTTTTGNQAVNLSSIPTGPTGTTARVVYRSKVGTTSPLFVVSTINDNTTTTFSDTTADASLTVQAPAHNSFGGSLLIQDSGGNNKAQIFSDGSMSYDAGNISSDGSGNLSLKALNANPAPVSINGGTNGTATVIMDFTGSWKRALVILNAFRTGGSNQNLVFPVAFTFGAQVRSGNIGSGFSLLNGGSAQNYQVLTALASGGGSYSTVSTQNGGSFGDIAHAFDTIQFPSGMASNHTATIIFEGQ